MAKRRKVVLLFVFLAIILVIFLPGYNKLQELKARNVRLKEEIEKLEQSNVDLKEEIVRIKTDPLYMEKVAREELGVVKEGEIIYKILPPVAREED